MDNMLLGYVLLAASILLTITGIGMSFSKKERERIQQRIVQELPERSAITGTPEALKAAQRRGYITLAIGIILFILWFIFFGPSTLAAI